MGRHHRPQARYALVVIRLLFVLALTHAVHFLAVKVENERLIIEEGIERERAIQAAFDETSYQGNRDPKTRRFFPGYSDADRAINLDVFVDGKWQVEADVDHATHYRKQMALLQRDRTNISPSAPGRSNPLARSSVAPGAKSSAGGEGGNR